MSKTLFYLSVLAFYSNHVSAQQQQSFEAIEVVAQRQPSRLGTTAIQVERLKAVPLLFGEADVMKSLSLTPGVATGVEGTAGLYRNFEYRF